MNEKHLIPEEIIRRKRDGETLGAVDIHAFVDGIACGEVSNEQIAALAMAIWFRGLDSNEQGHLTLAIRDSGKVLTWPDLAGPVLDKHSTGGVGDMVSFIAGPVVAACGGFVPMISGRGLGHTGGTLDKLESFPGIEVIPDTHTFQQWVRDRGIAIVGQSATLAPADQRIYAVRDATATVASRPLIISSILGKKLSEGLDGLVMDIKVGNGAFMETLAQGEELAREIRGVAQTAGLSCSAILSDMNRPLAYSAGNAVELREVIDYFTDRRRHPRLHEVATRIAAEMLLIGGLSETIESAREKVQAVLDDGSAAEVFAKMISGQGGPAEDIDRLERTLPQAPLQQAVYPDQSGWVGEVDMRKLGLAIVMLGGGRKNTGDRIDHAVGVSEIAGPGDEVGAEQPLAVVHAADENAWARARATLAEAFTVLENPPREGGPAVLARQSSEVEA